MSGAPPNPEQFYQQGTSDPSQQGDSASRSGNAPRGRSGAPSGPSMRTPTRGPGSVGYSSTPQTIPPVDRPSSDRSRADPVAGGQKRSSSRPPTARGRYRETGSGTEGEDSANSAKRPTTRRAPNDPVTPRRPVSTRRGSYPPADALEPSGDPVVPQSRRGSIRSVGSSGRPRGMSFYEAREYMKSGRAPRPESWHAGMPNQPHTDTSGSAPASPTSHTPAAMEEGLAPTDQPPLPPDVPNEKTSGNLGWALFLNSSAKNHLVATLGELIGTTMFLFFAFAGTQVANVNSPQGIGTTTTNATTGFNVSKLLYVSFAFGFSLMVNVWIFFRISGGLFNPAVTLALLLTGAIGAVRAIFLFFAQITGSIAASALLLGLFPTPANVRTTLSAGLSIPQGLFIEAFLTAELVFTILMLAKEKHKATFIAPVGIGLALFIAELVGVYWTGGSLNPARSIGPCIVTWTWDGTHWVYWIGPGLGCLIAVAFYKLIKLLEYEMANPGQDADDWNDPTKNPYHGLRERQRLVTNRVLRSLGFDPAHAHYQSGDEHMESLGSIHIYHKQPYGSQYFAGSGNAPGFGPLGTPVRRSEDDAYRLIGDKERRDGRGWER